MTFYLYDFLGIILAYLLGSIPFGYLITKIKTGNDIRNEGSGNIGATNVTRVLGKKWGIITFILDALKGIFAIVFAKVMHLQSDVILFIAYGAVLGHIAPIWFQFKGGKGVSTAFAVLTVLMTKISFIMGIIWIVIFKCFRISSLAAISAFVALPLLSIIMGYSKTKIIFSFMLSLTILYRHRSNITKLINKTENKF